METLIPLQQGVGGLGSGGWGRGAASRGGPRDGLAVGPGAIWANGAGGTRNTEKKVTPLTVFRIGSNLFCRYQPLLFRSR